MEATTFLAPIEHPSSIGMKLAYYFTKKKLGRVITPVKVWAARLPAAFGAFSGKIPQLDRKLTLPFELSLLIRERVAGLNVCLFCMDIGRWGAIQAKANMAKFDHLDEYATSPLFSERERAALDFVTHLTVEKKSTPEIFTRLSRFYSEREICEIVWLAATEHVYNITNIALNIHSDMFCDVTKQRRLSRVPA